jgi:hypothetical protein
VHGWHLCSKEFCAAWQGFAGGADAAAACGSNFKLFFQQAGEVVETCIPGLLGKTSQPMDSQVLETQDFYKKQAGDSSNGWTMSLPTFGQRVAPGVSTAAAQPFAKMASSQWPRPCI